MRVGLIMRRIRYGILYFVFLVTPALAEEDDATSATTIDKASDSKVTQEKTAKVSKDKINPPPVDVFELSEVEVIATTPLGTTGLESKKIAGNVQSVEDEDIHRHEAFALTDFMNRRLQSVNINDTQNNPYQPDVTYRGFTASPVLGTPIGVSVYQDGVRVNEPFGDTINWDLIPQVAVASMEMVPGSNPLFGLNTLGGAMSLRTKSGFSHPGFHAQANGGSFGRQAYQAEAGGSKGQFDWYFAGNFFTDTGWRPYSPTSVNQGFGKIGWENDRSDVDLSFTFADNNMQGVGPTPVNMLQEGWSTIYTAPDITKNTLYFVTLKGSHQFTDELQLTGNVYNRNNQSNNLNSNTNQDCVTWGTDATSKCTDSSGKLVNPGSFSAANTHVNGTGVNVQMTSDYKVISHENQLVIGGGYNIGSTDFSVASQEAFFNQNRYEIASSPLLTNVMINGQNTYANVFTTDTFSVFDWLHANASVNVMQAQVQTQDYLGTSLNGHDVYTRSNPSAGLTFDPLDAFSMDTPLKELTTYINYNEGFRTPTAVELSCANANAPCNLPNSFVSDPPLQAVVSHTWEVGARGMFSEALKWNFALYQTRNTNDILFLNSPGSVINGYFQNVGSTQRQGLELGFNGLAFKSLNWYMSYGFIDATYQTNAILTNSIGSETVKPGDRIPSIPQQTFKVGAEYELVHNWFVGSDLQSIAGQYARGDDLNITPQLPGYTLVNINTRYVLTKNIELFAMGRNIFDERYGTFAQLGQNALLYNQQTQFYGPGAPASVYAGIRIKWE